jgi:hypothetical protein
MKLITNEPKVDVHGGITTRRHIEGSTTVWMILRSALLDAASKYQAKHAKPMALVIDSADELAKCDPKFLELLQDFAKNCADLGILRVVFISSGGAALPLLMGRSAWSRAMEPVFEIGELTPDTEAVRYLVEKCRVPEDVAQQAVCNVTGGLFTSMIKFASNYSQGMKLKDLVETLDAITSTTLKDLHVSAEHPVFKHLVAYKSIRSDVARDLGMPKELLQALVDSNILSFHPNSTLTFHDRHVQVWFATHSTTTIPKDCVADSCSDNGALGVDKN